MEICVLLPSPENASQAGARIRYLRLAAALEAQGHRLTLEQIDAFRSREQLRHDVYLLSKCYDARCHVLSALLEGSPRLLGIDLFDDYFSQADDSRLGWMRGWLRSLGTQLDFFVCSTPRLEAVGRELLPGVPGRIVGDPCAPFDGAALEPALQAKRERAVAMRRIDVAWFGIGDNPQFPLGLHDLHAFSPALAALRRDAWQVELRILTNPRALTAAALEKLARLPVPWQLLEWSVEAEAAALDASLVAFLPVNAQPFSVAKSTNRAVSALVAGCQVLSAGYPLYASLDAFVYRDAGALLADLTGHRLRLRTETLPALLEHLGRHADASVEAAGLATFLQRRLVERGRAPRKVLPAKGALAVLHGVRSDTAVHRMAQRARQLSVATPYANPALNYDVRWVDAPSGPQAQLSDAAAARLRPELRRSLRDGVSPTGREVRVLDLPPPLAEPARRLLRAATDTTRAARLARYAEAVAAAGTLVEALLAATPVRLSETEPPFAVAAEPELER